MVSKHRMLLGTEAATPLREMPLSTNERPHMLGHAILVFGIAFVGATLGYMVGGSASPVVSVAVPAVFGLIATAIGLMQGNALSKDVLEVLKAHGDKANEFPEIREIRRRSKSAPLNIGISLIVFSIAYLSAATFGAKVRIDNLLATRPQAPSFPWASSAAKPPNIAAALDWIALQGALSDLGYDEGRIKQLYEIQTRDWTSRTVIGQSTAPPASQPAPSTAPVVPSSTSGDAWKEWLKQSNTPKGNPFANEPAKDVLDKYKARQQPGTPAPGQLPS